MRPSVVQLGVSTTVGVGHLTEHDNKAVGED